MRKGIIVELNAADRVRLAPPAKVPTLGRPHAAPANLPRLPPGAVIDGEPGLYGLSRLGDEGEIALHPAGAGFAGEKASGVGKPAGLTVGLKPVAVAGAERAGYAVELLAFATLA